MKLSEFGDRSDNLEPLQSLLKPVLDDHGRPLLVIADFVVNVGVCNFSCRYCLVSEAPEWAAFTPDSDHAHRDSTVGLPDAERLDLVMKRFSTAFDAVGIRISGGEIFQNKDVMHLLETASGMFEVVQIVTNGSLLTDERIAQLRDFRNCHLHVSLDGHTLQLNRHRVRSPLLQRKLLDTVDAIVAAGIPLEIGAVLTDANTAEFSSFLDYLMRYEGRLAVYPFPVRGDVSEEFAPTPNSVESFLQLLDSYERHAGVLPPRSYLEALGQLLQTGQRTLPCAVPRMMIQLFDDGNLSACPNGWSCKLGNVLTQEASTLTRAFCEHKIYGLMLQPRPRLRFCRGCYTSLDILSLYASGALDDASMQSIPLYRGQKVRSRLAQLMQGSV